MIKTFRDAEIAIAELREQNKTFSNKITQIVVGSNLTEARVKQLISQAINKVAPTPLSYTVPYLIVQSSDPYIEIDSGIPAKALINRFTNSPRLDLSVNWDLADAIPGYALSIYSDVSKTASWAMRMTYLDGLGETEIGTFDGNGSYIPGTDNVADLGSGSRTIKSLYQKRWNIVNNITPVTTNNDDIGDTTHFVRHLYTTGMRLNGGSASLPVKTNGSKDLVTAAINLASSEVTGVLPIANGGSGGGLSGNWVVLFGVTLNTTPLQYKDWAGVNQTLNVGVTLGFTYTTGTFNSGVLTAVV